MGCGFSTNKNAAAQPSPLQNVRNQSPVPGNFFGMHITDAAGSTPWPSVPFGTWRLWDAYVTWKDLEPRRGTWNFSRLDNLVALAKDHDTEVILPLALTPQWASARPDEPSAYTPGAAAEPASINDWTTYVRTVVRRYKGLISYYEMWNEVNVKATWTGTPAGIVALQEAAYKVIKAEDPDAKFISASVESAGALPYMRSLLALGYANSADIMGYHLYVSPDQPEAIAPLATDILSTLQQYKVNKPLWNTETGWLPDSTFTSEDEQAAVVVRALLMAESAGVSRFVWYAWDNHCCVTIFMTENDNATPTRAGLAYANTQKWLVGNVLGPCDLEEGMWSCSLAFADTTRGMIVWRPEGPDVYKLHLQWTPKVVEDMYGNDVSVTDKQVVVGEDPILLRED
jgi:hypothetical protein